MPKPKPWIITPGEFAKLLGATEDWGYRWIESGRFKRAYGLVFIDGRPMVNLLKFYDRFSVSRQRARARARRRAAAEAA